MEGWSAHLPVGAAAFPGEAMKEEAFPGEVKEEAFPGEAVVAAGADMEDE